MREKNFENPLFIEQHGRLPESIAIIGAGTIGPDIGYYLKSALPDLKLVLIDINEKALKQAHERILNYAQKGIDRGKISMELAKKVRSNIITSVDYQSMADCDWVMEAVTENLDLKKKIFSQIESIIRKDALITSNTSSLQAERLFAHLKNPERATVTHFFAPAFKNPVVEVVEWQQVDLHVIDHLRWLFYMTGKVPLVTADVVCFMLDRIFDNWCNEAALLLDEASAAEIDSVVSEFVHAGPFFVLNMANGNPIIVETNSQQMSEEGDHYQPAAIFNSVNKWLALPLGKTIDVSPEKKKIIRDRMLGIFFSQTVDILDRNIGDTSDLDLGCCLALGFKKGPIELMKEMGEKEVKRILAEFNHYKPGMPTPDKPVNEYFNYYRFLLVSKIENIVIITLRRPEAMNALHNDMTDEILDVIRSNEGDPIIEGFIITGYGIQAFCAGADIGRFPDMLGNKQQSIDYARDCSRLLVHLDQCTKPVVAAINGMALGGGMELAIRCHGMIAVNEAWMQLPEITLGIAPGIGAMVVPYRKWPHASDTFHDMLLRAKKLSAKEAHGAGIVDEVIKDHSELIPAAIKMVREIAVKEKVITDKPIKISVVPAGITESDRGQILSNEIVGIIGQAVTAAAEATSLVDALEVGYAAFGDSACTAAAKEGISAFLERRQADFSQTG